MEELLLLDLLPDQFGIWLHDVWKYLNNETACTKTGAKTEIRSGSWWYFFFVTRS